ncbi:MAG: flagellar protein FlaG [Azoarcus sp.]|nr:flagellar protein FlaG [Azoarcus sp.]
MSIQSATSIIANSAAALSVPAKSDSQQAAAANSAAEDGNTVTGLQAPRKPTSVQEASIQELSAALEEVQKTIRPVASELNFSLEEDTGRMLVKIVDMETDEVIRQIPSEELLRISKALDKLQGLLLNSEA